MLNTPLKTNPRFHCFSLDDLFRYAILSDRNCLECWQKWKMSGKQYFHDVAKHYRSEFWACVMELACRYNPALGGAKKW